MEKKIYAQVVVIGSGPAGYSAAFRCSDLGLNTILIERYRKLGGVCLNVGCIPSKALLHIAKVVTEAKELSESGILFNTPIIDINQVQRWKEKVIGSLNIGLSSMAKKRNIKVIVGTAKFLSNQSLLVESKKEKILVIFENVIIATGSHAIQLPGIPNDKRIWNSTDALSLKNIPNRLLIIGGGVIGLEMATIYSALGSKIDILDTGTQLLPVVDKDVIDIFIHSINNKFNLILNQEISTIQSDKQGITVTMVDSNNIKKSNCYDSVLVAIGRKANYKDLNINSIGIELDSSNFIKTDKQLRTNISNIYAIGDVIGQPMLAHKGIHEGHLAAEVIAGKKHFFMPKVIPCVAYTDPEIAWVGLTEQEAMKQNINYRVGIFPWSASGRALTSHSHPGLTKLIFDKNTNRIIGGIVIGRNASELLSEISLAIEMGCDAEDIALTIHAHPTLYESIGLAAEVFQGTVTDLINIK
ncbi:dihydrolipoyl dehydrogenase [Buchnera aphidicola]|uniref:dihydrolipoyl dehydrogenase n=1 Tax=Buchnera aphidicola TaxID=9 RepID=UPI00346479AB